MSAQSKNRKSRLVSKKRISSKRSYRNTKVSKNFRNFGIRLLICLVIIILALFYFFQPGEFWSAKRKTVVAFQEKSGDVTVAVFDPNLQEIISIFVPADTAEVTGPGTAQISFPNCLPISAVIKAPLRLAASTT